MNTMSATSTLEPFDIVLQKMRISARKGVDHLIAFGQYAAEVKRRISDPNSDEGEPWGWSWNKFWTEERVTHLPNVGVRHVRQAISFAESGNPELAIREHRERKAANMRAARARTAEPRGSDPSSPVSTPDPQPIDLAVDPLDSFKSAFQKLNADQRDQAVSWIISQLEAGARSEQLAEQQRQVHLTLADRYERAARDHKFSAAALFDHWQRNMPGSGFTVWVEKQGIDWIGAIHAVEQYKREKKPKPPFAPDSQGFPPMHHEKMKIDGAFIAEQLHKAAVAEKKANNNRTSAAQLTAVVQKQAA
jgi:hypothetical protein